MRNEVVLRQDKTLVERIQKRKLTLWFGHVTRVETEHIPEKEGETVHNSPRLGQKMWQDIKADIYRVAPKSKPQTFVHRRQILTDFQIFFTGTLCGKLAIGLN